MLLLSQFIAQDSHRWTPRWYVLLIDACSILLAYALAVCIRFNFNLEATFAFLNPEHMLIVGAVYVGLFYVFRTFNRSVRHTAFSDLIQLFYVLTGAAIASAISMYAYVHWVLGGQFSGAIIAIHYLLACTMVIGSRIIFRMLVQYFHYRHPDTVPVLIFGAGHEGLAARIVLQKDVNLRYRVLGFVDDYPGCSKGVLNGVTIYRTEEALTPEFIDAKGVKEVIFAEHNIPAARKAQLMEMCVNLGLSVKSVPPLSKWVDGSFSSTQLKKINIEDLLNRAPIVLDKEALEHDLRDKVVLVSGAAGSIGSEIARQVLSYQPKTLVLLDQSETGLYDIERIIAPIAKAMGVALEPVLADVTNEQRILSVFHAYRPDYVYHAAAYKHVPLMEQNPAEAIRVNVRGSKQMADTAVHYGVKKFVMVSTDKAVNPTNVMGASKRIAEIYVQSLNAHQSQTKFVTTRFGNVLGSNGSVVPLFKEQIENGGPITVTSDKITRYFMTIPEACQLVLEAGSLGKGGEIFVFDMGCPVRIIDLAKKMIQLSGLREGIDIDIKVTGLRPGEKLYEELLNNEENTLPTHHPKIMVGKVRTYDYQEAKEQIDALIATHPEDAYAIVRKMKEIVPEFVSNNSVYEVLDGAKVVL